VPDHMDSEIASLLGVDDGSSKAANSAQGGQIPPDFEQLFGDLDLGKKEDQAQGKTEGAVDFSKKSFAPVAKLQEDQPATFFADPDYYKKALNGEGEEAQRVHELLGKFLKASDPKDKGIYRQQLITAFGYLLSKEALHSVPSQAPLPKQLLVRFGVLLPSLLTQEQLDILSRIVFKKNIDEPVYYADEWVKAVARGQINQSATDEIKPQAGDDKAHYNALIQRATGKRDATEGILKSKAEERRSYENLLKEKVGQICQHDMGSGAGREMLYSDAQKKAMSEVNELMRRMLAADKEMGINIGDLEKANEELKSAMTKAGEFGQDAKADFQAVAQEFETIKQMTKLCVGRQGNHFPILTREYFHGSLKDVATRENVIRILAWIESIDCEAFCRSYKNTLNRIVPFTILLPCYGDSGICWEPFDRFNRASSRGRIAVPMYPKDLISAVLSAVADLRWQVAKEKASYYWMEEGLTGNYYQWFTAHKMKGDVREYFMADYLIWITKESEGIQKLDKDIRQIFWQYMPFSKAIKEKLKGRSYIYQELYQKDINRSLSDGY